MTSSDTTLIPGLNMLGYGYDVFASPYCDLQQVKGDDKGNCLLSDFDASDPTKTKSVALLNKTYRCPTTVIVRSEQPKDVDYTLYADTSEDYRTQLTVNAHVGANVSGFAGSIDSSFSSTSSSYLESVFGEHGHIYSGIDVRVPLYPSALRALLNPTVAANLHTFDPEMVINVYGTHLVTGVMIGGKAFLRQSSQRSEVSNSTDWQIAVKASYAAITASASVDEQTKSTQKTFRMSTDVQTLGGTGIIIEGEASDSKGKFQQWRNSIADTPAIIDMTALVPLWQLIEPGHPRRAQLKAAIIAYARRYQPGAIMGARLDYSDITEHDNWKLGASQLEAVGRPVAISAGMTWRDGDNRASRERLFLNTGLESQTIQRMAVYGGAQAQSNETESDPFTPRSSWGATPDTGAKNLQTLQIFDGFVYEPKGGPFIIDTTGKKFTIANLYVGPIETAQGDCWVPRGGYSIFADGARAYEWGISPTTSPGTPLTEKKIMDCVAWSGDWKMLTTYMYLQPVLTELAEMQPDGV